MNLNTTHPVRYTFLAGLLVLTIFGTGAGAGYLAGNVSRDVTSAQAEYKTDIFENRNDDSSDSLFDRKDVREDLEENAGAQEKGEGKSREKNTEKKVFSVETLYNALDEDSQKQVLSILKMKEEELLAADAKTLADKIKNLSDEDIKTLMELVQKNLQGSKVMKKAHNFFDELEDHLEDRFDTMPEDFFGLDSEDFFGSFDSFFGGHSFKHVPSNRGSMDGGREKPEEDTQSGATQKEAADKDSDTTKA